MSRKADVIIVGAGLAGFSAALAAVQAGCSVRMIARGMGSLAISSGTVDVLGYVNGHRLASPWEGMARLSPLHPYSLLGTKQVQADLQWLMNCACKQSWPMHAAFSANGQGCNTLLPTIMGTLKPTYLMPAGFDPYALARAKRVLIMSVKGLRDCRPALIADQLQRYKEWANRKLIQVTLPSPLPQVQRSMSPLDLARFVDRPEGLDWLLSVLSSYRTQADVLLLPPICGSNIRTNIWQDINHTAGCPVIEMISIPPGVGGLRLRDLFLRSLQQHSFDLVENATVIGAERYEDRCTALRIRCAGEVQTCEARAFILATGGILGGGINVAPGQMNEAILGINIPVPADVTCWSQPEIFGSHLFCKVGVHVDHAMRPLTNDGKELLLKNVFFAGRSLAGYDFTAEKSGHGVALCTGRMAGRMAAAIVHSGQEKNA